MTSEALLNQSLSSLLLSLVGVPVAICMVSSSLESSLAAAGFSCSGAAASLSPSSVTLCWSSSVPLSPLGDGGGGGGGGGEERKKERGGGGGKRRSQRFLHRPVILTIIIPFFP